MKTSKASMLCKVSRWLAIAAMVGGALGAAGRAEAQPADGNPVGPDKVAQADALFSQGKALMAAGKLAEACTAFERSQVADPKITTLVNHANCREKNHQLATAARLFAEAVEQLRGVRDEGGVALHKLATDRVATLTPRLSTLTLRVAADQPAGFEVLLGDHMLDAAAWIQARPIDGGAYAIAARAPGFRLWVAKVTVREQGDALVVEIPALVPAAAVDSVPSPALVANAPGSRSLVLPISLGAGAVVLGGVALGLELHGESLQSKAVDEFDAAERFPQSDPQRAELIRQSDAHHDSANVYRHLAQGVAVAAVGCAGAAVYLYARSRRAESSSATARRTVTPLVTPTLAGLQVQGRW